MRLRTRLAAALLAALLAAHAAAPAGAASVGARPGSRPAVESAVSKRFRKLMDYIGCIVAIVNTNEINSGISAVVACAKAAETWKYE